MSRYPRGITLTPEERARVQTAPLPLDDPDSPTPAAPVTTHPFSLALPDGTVCTVTYTRLGARSHQFHFEAPLGQRLYHSERIPGGLAAIEATGRELLPQALARAREEEQLAMRGRGMSARHSKGRLDTGPEMDARTATRFAGQYAVCVRSATGRLLRVGPVHAKLEAAQAEIEAGRHASLCLVNGQALVVGICNGPARRWQEPQFLCTAASEKPDSTEEPLEGDAS